MATKRKKQTGPPDGTITRQIADQVRAEHAARGGRGPTALETARENVRDGCRSIVHKVDEADDIRNLQDCAYHLAEAMKALTYAGPTFEDRIKKGKKKS